MSASLILDHVGKSYTVDGRVLPVLADISLDIASGEFVSLVGASGCGKSTLLRLLVGLEPDFSGGIAFDGKPVTGPSLDRGIVFQEPRLMPWLTVEQNIAFGLLNTGISDAEKKDRVARHIDLVRLNGFERALPRQLSGGMAQRVAIARALVNEPSVLLLDEPFGALDALTRSHLQDQLLEIWQRRRITAVFVTHDVEEAVYLSDRVVVLQPNPGRVATEVRINLKRPRTRTDAAFARLREDVLGELVGASTAGTAANRPQPLRVVTA
jgi:ABC-type nitrate/sulfonate/bicarbonate transport system ATPase subunit